jgi:hypothetical protein
MGFVQWVLQRKLFDGVYPMGFIQWVLSSIIAEKVI